MTETIKNEVEARVYDEDWSVPAILIFSMLVTVSTNPYGVYLFPKGKVRRFFHGIFSREEPDVEAALEELKILNQIRLYRDDKVIWIVEKWGTDRYSTNRNNCLGAVNFLQENYPDVVDDFMNRYPVDDLPAPSKKKAPAKPKKKGPKCSERALKLVEQLFPGGENKEAQGLILDRIDRKPGKNIVGYSWDKLCAVLTWAAQDDFWGGLDNFGSCAPLRNRKEKGGLMKYEKIWGAYERANSDDGIGVDLDLE